MTLVRQKCSQHQHTQSQQPVEYCISFNVDVFNQRDTRAVRFSSTTLKVQALVLSDALSLVANLHDVVSQSYRVFSNGAVTTGILALTTVAVSWGPEDQKRPLLRSSVVSSAFRV
jgi:hypothetical protein